MELILACQLIGLLGLYFGDSSEGGKLYRTFEKPLATAIRDSRYFDVSKDSKSKRNSAFLINLAVAALSTLIVINYICYPEAIRTVYLFCGGIICQTKKGNGKSNKMDSSRYNSSDEEEEEEVEKVVQPVVFEDSDSEGWQEDVKQIAKTNIFIEKDYDERVRGIAAYGWGLLGSRSQQLEDLEAFCAEEKLLEAISPLLKSKCSKVLAGVSHGLCSVMEMNNGRQSFPQWEGYPRLEEVLKETCPPINSSKNKSRQLGAPEILQLQEFIRTGSQTALLDTLTDMHYSDTKECTGYWQVCLLKVLPFISWKQSVHVFASLRGEALSIIIITICIRMLFIDKYSFIMVLCIHYWLIVIIMNILPGMSC